MGHESLHVPPHLLVPDILWLKCCFCVSGTKETRNPVVLCKGSVYGLLTKCEVKMAGYWPSYFFGCLRKVHLL